MQTGDPTNTSKNSQAIWGLKFEHELKENLKHTDMWYGVYG